MSETTVKAATPNLNKALSQLQGELPKVTKAQEGKVEGESKASGKAFSYTYKYADLADVTAAVGPLLAKYGLSFFAAPTIDPANRGQMILAWSLLHESGEERNGEWPLGPANQKPQALGSMVTYARRYCLGAATGIVAEEDDDGQRAQRDHGSRQSAGDLWDKSAPAPSRQDGDGNGQQPAQDGDPWVTPPATDQKWLAATLKVVSEVGLEACRNLWRETSEKFRAGELAEADRVRVLGLLKARMEALANPSSGTEAAPPAAAGLDPGDPWALKVEEITEGDYTAAREVLEEAIGMLGREEIDAEYFDRIEAAIEARFPKAAAEGQAAA